MLNYNPKMKRQLIQREAGLIRLRAKHPFVIYLCTLSRPKQTTRSQAKKCWSCKGWQWFTHVSALAWYVNFLPAHALTCQTSAGCLAVLVIVVLLITGGSKSPCMVTPLAPRLKNWFPLFIICGAVIILPFTKRESPAPTLAARNI